MPYLERTLLKANGVPRLQVKVVLINDSLGAVKAWDTSTDEDGIPDGHFRIPTDSLPSGEYHLEYYGDGILPTEFYTSGNLSGEVKQQDPVTPWEYNIEIISVEGIEPISFAVSPVLAVAEGSTGEDLPDSDINKAEDTMVILSFSSLICTVGRIRKIAVYRKISSDTTYLLWKEFNFDESYSEVDSGLDTATFRERMMLRDKPENYDFRTIFINENDDPAVTGGTPVYADDTAVVFNGVADISEYVEVKDLICTNIAGGGAGDLPGMVADLEWTDPRQIVRGSWGTPTYTDAFGDTVSPAVTWAQAQKIYDFVIYMAVSINGNDADYPRPGTDGGETETEVNWYHMGHFKAAKASIRCPAGAKVNFWVGFQMERSSPTTTTDKLEY